MITVTKGQWFPLTIGNISYAGAAFDLQGATEVSASLVSTLGVKSALSFEVTAYNELSAVSDGSLSAGKYAIEVSCKGADGKSYRMKSPGAVIEVSSSTTPSTGSSSVRVAGDEWELTADVEMHEGQARTYMSLLEDARQKAVKAAEEATEAANAVDAAKAACEEQTAKTEKSNSDITAAEAVRVEAENKRAQSEQSRESAEAGRVSAEKARVAAETARAAAEDARKAAETQRKTAFASAKEACETATKNATAATDKANTAADKANDATAAATKAEKERQDAENARKEAESSRVEAEQGRAEAENARVTAENERVKNENARAQAEAARVTAEEKRAEDIGQAVSKANTASEVAVTANEPFIWKPFEDLEHWNITAMDFGTGTVTLETDEHGLAVGDLVTLAANIHGYLGTYALGRSWEDCMSSSSMKEFPVKIHGAIPSMDVTAVNGAEIQLDTLKVSTSIVPVPSEWQLQRCAMSGRKVALPTRFKGKPITVTVEGQYVSYNSSWNFFRAQRVLSYNMGYPIFSPIGDENCGLPFVKQICSMRSGHVELADIGVNLYGEDISLGSTPTQFFSLDKEDGWDISRATNLVIERILGHYATRVTVTSYRELTKMG